MKTHALSGLILEDAWLTARAVQEGLIVVGELALASWLLLGVFPRHSRIFTLWVFVVFAAVSFYRGLAGSESCECFGQVKVNPWTTFTLDLVVIGTLLLWRPAAHGAPTHIPRGRMIVAAAALLVFLLPAAWRVAHMRGVTLDDFGQVVGDGSIVILEPERWLGNPFPLISHIDTGERLRTGEWTAVLYRHDCGDCRRALPKYEQMAREGRRVMLVEIPPHPAASQDTVPHGSPLVRGKLLPGREWFVETPAMLELRDGAVVRHEPRRAVAH